MDQPTATVLAALVGFIGGLIAARSVYQQKSDELFFKALDYLGGGTQRRNLGIAAIELYWANKRHRPVSVSLLIGAALYLLIGVKRKDTAHEIHNLKRIMSHLKREDARASGSQSQYEQLLKAVVLAQQPNRSTGLVIDSEELEGWQKALEALAMRE